MAQLRARYEQTLREVEDRELRARERLLTDHQTRVHQLEAERARVTEEIHVVKTERSLMQRAVELRQQALNNLVLVLAGEVSLNQGTQRALMLSILSTASSSPTSSSSSSSSSQTPTASLLPIPDDTQRQANEHFADGLRQLRDALKSLASDKQAVLMRQLQQQEAELRGARQQLSTSTEEQAQTQQRLQALRDQLSETQAGLDLVIAAAD